MPKKEKAPKKGKEAEAKEETKEPETWTCAECEQVHEGEDATAIECVACGEPKPMAAVPAEDDDDRFKGYKCGLITGIEDIADKLKACTIDVGGGDGQEVTIVTNAPNVGEGVRVVVATVGAIVGDEALKAKTVGGRTSQGMLCDAPMLGWTGGGAGNAALVPDAFAPGARPPDRRPRMDGK
jgi:tRNA-binding EMAP/Myf-like protein